MEKNHFLGGTGARHPPQTFVQWEGAPSHTQQLASNQAFGFALCLPDPLNG